MKIFRNPDVLWRDEDQSRELALERLSRGESAEDIGTSVLFSDGMMLSLNLLGTEIWRRCDGKSVDEIVADLLQRFEADPDVIRKDGAAFLHELSRKGFIHYEQ